MANKITVFLHDGVIEGVFATSPDMQVCVVEFDSSIGDQTIENARWAACQAAGMVSVFPEYDYCEK
jgi:hypothetical protein